MGRLGFAVCVALAAACGRSAAADWWVDLELTGTVQNIAAADYAVAPEGSVTAASASARATVTGSFGAGLSGLLSVEGWFGDGFEPTELDPDVIPVNGDLAVRTSRAITEAYLTAELGLDRLKLSVGLVDVSSLIDTNRVANDPRIQFLHYAFRNSTAIEFPGGDYAPRSLAAWFSLENRAIRGGPLRPVGFVAGCAKMDEDSDDLYYFGELRLCPLQTLRVNIFGWQAGGPHARWDGGPAEDSSSGFGLSADWEPPLTGEVMFFLRAAFANGEVAPNRFSSSLSFGFQMSGSPWGRGSDTVGAAYSSSFLSDDYKATLGPNAEDAESVLELYYKWQVLAPDLVRARPGLEVTPSWQIIHNAGGQSLSRDTQILSLRIRTILSF